MNLRRVIRVSVSILVSLLALTSAGVVLWVADEGLGWNLFPDWLEECAYVLLASIGLLTVFAAASCVCASAALAALSAADRSGTEPEREPSKVHRWAVRGVAAALVLAVAVGVALQKVDDWRAKRLRAEYRAEHARSFEAVRADLAKDAAVFAAKVSPDLMPSAGGGDTAREKELSVLLSSFAASSQFGPSVWLVVRGEPPYVWRKLSPNPKARDPDEPWLLSSPLVDLPSVWERDTVSALFNGAELTVPHGRSGAVLDTREPCAWHAVESSDGSVAALLVLRTPVRLGWGKHHKEPTP